MTPGVPAPVGVGHFLHPLKPFSCFQVPSCKCIWQMPFFYAQYRDNGQTDVTETSAGIKCLI